MDSKVRAGSLVIVLIVWLSLFFVCVSEPEAPAAADKDTVVVDQSGRGDFLTIREAVEAAREGQRIRIRGGVYHEAVTADVGRITLEAADPAGDPVVWDGADQGLLAAAIVWEPAGENLFKTDYQWPLTPAADAEYSNPESGKYVFQVYEDEELLRGYRNPFDPKVDRDKKPVRFPGGRYGLAGAYASAEELAPDDPDRPGAAEAVGATIKPALSQTGRCSYDPAAKKLLVAPAEKGDPNGRRYAVPIIPHLLVIKADSILVRNLVFTHAVDYAVAIEAGEGTVIDGCLFLNAHFAVSAGRGEVELKDNVIVENGFWERYRAEDVAGTLYARSAVRLGKTARLSGNLVRGTPFFFPSGSGQVDFTDNVVSRSVFALFPPPPAPGFKGRITIGGSLFHHLDGGIGLPRLAPGGERLILHHNVFYLADAAGGSLSTGWESGRPCFIYNNVLAFAGPALQRPFTDLFDSSSKALNNLYYARNIEYGAFVDNGIGRPYPVIGGPVLGSNLFLTPAAESAGWGTFEMKGDTYVFARVGGSGTEAADGKPRCFAGGKPFVDTVFYHDQFDPLSLSDSEVVYRDGAAAFSRAYRERLFSMFSLSEKSPAINMGRLLPADLPGAAAPRDRKPDIGAREYAPYVEKVQ